MAKGIEWESRIGRRLRLRDLHVLFAVVQSGTMSGAASTLGVSQPVVSEAVANLQATGGCRVRGRIRLSPPARPSPSDLRSFSPPISADALSNRASQYAEHHARIP